MFPCFTVLVLLGIVIGLFYLFLVWNFGYWKKRGVKEGKTIPFVGSFPSQFTQKRNLFYDIDELYNQYKKTENFVGVYNCRAPTLLVLTPEYARRVFVNDFKYFHDNLFSSFVTKSQKDIFANNPFVLKGEEWKERRAEITPGLTANRVSSVYPVSLKVCRGLADYIKKQAKMATKDGLDTKEICLRYTTEVVSDCVLGIEANSFTDASAPIYHSTKKVFNQSYFFMMYIAVSNLLPAIRKIYMPSFFSAEGQAFFCNLMATAIELRRKSSVPDRTDFLNYILTLQEKKNLSLEDLTSHSMTFLTDGFETTANVLAHTLLFLARHPDTQQKLRDEIGTQQLSFQELSDLPYLEGCIFEAIRIFPPQIFARKLCTQTYEFVNKDGSTVAVEPGTPINIPSASIHRDPEFFPEPFAFKPERFMNGGLKNFREAGTLLGFGEGPRICPGMRFALTQMKAALVEIVRNFNFTVNPKTRNDFTMDDTYFMSILKGGIWLDFEERK